MPDVGVDLLLQARDLGAELAMQERERLHIERHAGRFHPGEDRDERELDLAEETVQTVARSAAAAAGRGPPAPTALRAQPALSRAARCAGGRIWSRCSATTSAIVWLRSAAFRM